MGGEKCGLYRFPAHEIDLPVGEAVLRPVQESRRLEVLEVALHFGKGFARVSAVHRDSKPRAKSLSSTRWEGEEQVLALLRWPTAATREVAVRFGDHCIGDYTVMPVGRG